MIIRRKHNGNFTVIGNEPMNDERLSAEALGVLCYLRSRPDNWNVIPEQLAERFDCGRNRIYRIIKELIDGLYITRTQKQDQLTKTWQSSEYIVYDEQSSPATSSKPHTQNRDTLISTDSKQVLKVEQIITWPDDYENLFWKTYPRKIGKQAALKALARVKKSNSVDWQQLISSLEKFRSWAATKDVQYVKHPATWLNAGCWDDELTNGEFKNGSRRRTVQDAAADLAERVRAFTEPGSNPIRDGQGQASFGLLPKG